MNTFYQDHNDNVTTIDADYLHPQLASSHLIVANNHAAFIDTGTNYSANNLLAVLKDKAIPPENVDYVILTHVHLDHAGGAGKLMQLFPNAQLVVHPRGAPHMIDPSRLIAGVEAVYGKARAAELYGEILPVAAERVIEAGEGYELDFQGRLLHFLDTPGHAKHHVSIWDVNSRSVFSGDTFGLSYRLFDTDNGAFIFPTTTPVQFDPDALHNSVRRLMALEPQQFFLTHYGKIDGNLNQLADEQHKMIDEFVELTQTVTQQEGDRHAVLVERLMQALITRIQAHGCTLPETDIKAWLAMDVDLNAQGLLFWWDKNQKKAA